MKGILSVVVLTLLGCPRNENPGMLMHEHSVGGNQMAFRRVVPRGNVPVIRESHGVDETAFGEAPPEIEFTRDDVQEFDATEEVPDALEQLREVIPTSDPISILSGKVITFGDQVGRFVTVPFAATSPGTEILAVRSEDSINGVFTVALQQRGFWDPAIVPGTRPQRYVTSANRGTWVWAQWGAGGAQFETLVDVGRGQVFSVSGSFLRLIAFNNTAEDVDVGAFVSLLPRAANKSPTFTVPSGVIAALATVGFGPVPAFARTLKIYRQPFATGFTVRFMADGGAILGEIVVAASTDVPELILPNNVTDVQIINGAAQIDAAQGIFLLGL